jgi:hypothetical protein
MYGFSIEVSGNAVAALQQIETQLSSLGLKASLETAKVESSFAGLHQKVGSAFGNLKGMILGGLGISAAFAGFEFIKASKEAFDNLESSVAQVKASLASTKGAAGMGFEDINNSAKELSKNTLFGRSAILDMQSVLLTFPSITKETFPSASAAILDMATKLKSGPTEAAIQLGKALQDPEKGITALHRVGVNTDELKKKFETVTSTLERQKLIIGELNTEFGGSAKAAANTDEGKVLMAKKSWGEIKLTIGEIVSKLQVAFIPLLLGMTKALKNTIEFFKEGSVWAEVLKIGLLAIGGILAAYQIYLGIVAAKTAIVTAAQWAWNVAMMANSIGIIIGLIAAFAAGIYVLVKRFGGFKEMLKHVWEIIKAFGIGVAGIFIGLNEVITGALTLNPSKIAKGLSDTVNAYKEASNKISAVWNDTQDNKSKAFLSQAEGAAKMIEQTKEKGGYSKKGFHNVVENLGFKIDDAIKKGLATKEDKENIFSRFHEFQKGPGATSNTGTKDAAINTSSLSGASGGLGQAKIVNIHFHEALQKNIVNDSKDLKHRGQEAIEQVLRVVNNIAYSQSTQ